jgi:hypothetical protein
VGRWLSRVSGPSSLFRRRGLVGVGLAMTFVLVGIGSLVAVNAMARQTVQEEHVYGFKGKALSIDLTIGEVQIVPGADDDQITVRRRLTYGLRRPHVEERIDGETFRVSDSDCAIAVGAPCHVKWLLQVPRNLHVAITTKSGDITVSGLAGAVNLTSTSGAVKARALSGQALQLLSHEGSVTGTDIRSTHVVATSQSGDISLGFRTPPKLVRGQTKTGSVGVVLPDGDETYKIVAVTVSGSKTITARHDPDADRSINVKSETGAVTVLQSPANPTS